MIRICKVLVAGMATMALAVPMATVSRASAQPPWSPYGQAQNGQTPYRQPPYAQPQTPYAQPPAYVPPQSPYTQPGQVTPYAPVAPTSNATQMVWHWYRRYLHRRPDPDGLRNCVAQLESGQTPTAVKAGLLGSGEYYQDHGNNPEGFVTGLYTDVLGRAPSPRGLGYWLNQLNADSGNRQQLALDFLKWVQNAR